MSLQRRRNTFPFRKERAGTGQEPGWWGVHDGVRPVCMVEVIRRCYELAKVQKAVIPVVDVVETLRHLDGMPEAKQSAGMIISW